MKNLNNSAFTLLEVLLSAIIFVVSVAGIFASLDSVRTPVANKENELTAAVFGKQVLEGLRSQVSANFYASCSFPNGDNTCGDFSLYLGKHEIKPVNQAITMPAILTASNVCAGAGIPSGCLSYTVFCGDGNGDNGNNVCNGSASVAGPDVARGVNLNINWPTAT